MMRVPNLGDKFIYRNAQTYFVVKVDDKDRLWLRDDPRYVPRNTDDWDWSRDTWEDVIRYDAGAWKYVPRAPDHMRLPAGA